jgi:CIC family chloride channel protein
MEQKERSLNGLVFAALAILAGVIAGLGAVVFRYLIGFFHNLFFLGQFSFSYNALVYTPPSPWGPFVIFVPVAGAFIVAFLVRRYAPEAKGHGVPEVMDAIYYHRGVIRPIVALIKTVASAVTIGTGGSVGREGPIVQIGSSFGSTVGQLLRLSPWQVTTLIACGAGGGIAATFNTPVGGILFGVELILHEVSARTLVPMTLAAATASYVGRLFLGDHPAFVIPPLQLSLSNLTTLSTLTAFLGLGLLAGLLSTAYTRSIYVMEDVLERRFSNYYIRHPLSMLLVGIIFYMLFLAFGEYYTEGLGYDTIQHVLLGRFPAIWLLLLLMVLKLLATSLTLGSGGSGGVFSPGLFMGATLGAAYGLALAKLAPNAIDPTAFSVAGMAGVIGGATGAAVTAIVMIFEMTRDYDVIIPMAITVAVSYGLRRFLSRDSIYTLKLARRGQPLPDALQTNLHFRTRAVTVMDRHVLVMDGSWTVRQVAQALGRLAPADTPSLIVTTRAQGEVLGVVRPDELLTGPRAPARQTTRLQEASHTDFSILSENSRLVDVIGRLRRDGSAIGLVVSKRRAPVSGNDVLGFITKERLVDALSVSADLFARE